MDVGLQELYTQRPDLIWEDHKIPEKYHKQLNMIFKKYYHTAIRKSLSLIIMVLLVYLIMNNIFDYKPFKITSIIMAASIAIITIALTIYPLMRINQIKKRHYRWYIGNSAFARNNYIYVDNEKGVPTNKSDYKQMNWINQNNIYILVKIKNKKYAINTHTSDINDLAA